MLNLLKEIKECSKEMDIAQLQKALRKVDEALDDAFVFSKSDSEIIESGRQQLERKEEIIQEYKIKLKHAISDISVRSIGEFASLIEHLQEQNIPSLQEDLNSAKTLILQFVSGMLSQLEVPEKVEETLDNIENTRNYIDWAGGSQAASIFSTDFNYLIA